MNPKSGAEDDSTIYKIKTEKNRNHTNCETSVTKVIEAAILIDPAYIVNVLSYHKFPYIGSTVDSSTSLL